MEEDVWKLIITLDDDIRTKTNINDFWIEKMNSSNLILAGSFDHGYYHEIEITFTEVKYISCPGGIFNVSKFRSASEEERNKLIEQKVFGNEWLNPKCNVIILEDNIEETKYHIVFEEMSYKFETVFHYIRDNLKEGERIAEWVNK